tara:strand:- start:39 stop:251 length:213 start_codon:yes stop_codon:yes gene_type:complete
MKTLKTREIPAQEAKTIYTIELDVEEVTLLKIALGQYHKHRQEFMGYLNAPTEGDAWLALAKEIESSLPD